MQVDIDARLDRWQSELLDLTRRNRMLNYRLTSRSTLSIVEPGFDELYARLGAEGATLSFQRPLDRMTDARVYSLLALMEALGTPLPVVLGDIKTEGTMLERQRTLANLRQKARLALEEQGANILFLSLGFLKWRDGEGAQGVDRLAPLVLMPVNITQATVGAPLMLERRDEEVVANQTLEYFLRSTYGIQMPAFDSDAPALDEYLNGVQQLVSGRGWRVVRAASLGLLSFLKLSMYQDMERNRAAMRAHPVIRAIAGDRSALTPGEDVAWDFHDAQDPADSCQVVSADSSQQDAIELSRRGESFIMQGPPGTGKSQTITNMIAQALADGRRVLFVAEKMAALQVVYRKLQDAGLSDFCLPIHSHKANKRDVLSELKRTLELDRPQVRDEARAQLEQLRRTRDALNAYARQLHAPLGALGLSVYEACGELAQLRTGAALAKGGMTGAGEAQLAGGRDACAGAAAKPNAAAAPLDAKVQAGGGGTAPFLNPDKSDNANISDTDACQTYDAVQSTAPVSAAAAGASVTPVAADVRGGDAHDNHNTQSTDISQAARDRAEYAALAPRTVALIKRLARVSFAVEDAPALDAAALALRCERARVYGAARADCPIDNPFEGVCAAGGLARRGELMRALEAARDGVDELATLMSELRARGVRKVTLEDLDALRAALQAASSARLLPESWLGERDGARLRALCAGLRVDAGQLAQGLADIESVCDARVLDVDFDAICALLDVLVRVDGAPPRSGDELRSGVERLRALTGEVLSGVAGLLARARAYCALTGVAGDNSLAAADSRRVELELLQACVGLPEGCVLAEPGALEALRAPLAEKLERRAQLTSKLGRADVDLTDWDAARHMAALESARDIAAGVHAAGLATTPEGIERWAGAAQAARERYGRLCDAVTAAARAAQVEGDSLDAALRACALLDMLGDVPPAWADAGVRSQLAGALVELRARAQELARERSALETRFTARAFAPETARLLTRFNSMRGSVLRMFRPAYHADRQQMRECFRNSELSDEDMARQLSEAVEHASRAGELSAELWARAPLLGRHLAADGSVAWDQLTAELSAFAELCGLLGAQGALLAANQPDRTPVAALREAILALRRGVEELGQLGVQIDLDKGAASGLDACAQAAARGRALAAQVRESCAALGAPDADYETACEYVRAAQELNALDAALRHPGDGWRVLGAELPRTPAEWAALERGMAALGELARAQGGRLTMRTRELLLSRARDRLMAAALADAGAWASARAAGAQPAGEGADISAARLCEDAARLLGADVDGAAPAELCAALEALLGRAAQGAAAFDEACTALKPGVPERRIADYARDFAHLRALRRRLGADGEAAAALGELWRGADTNWAYLDDCVTLLEQVRAARARLSGFEALIDGAFGRGPADALCDKAIMALGGAQRARAALEGAQVGESLLQLEPDALKARLERCLARPELLAAQVALDAARQDCVQAGMAGFVRAVDAEFAAAADGMCDAPANAGAARAHAQPGDEADERARFGDGQAQPDGVISIPEQSGNEHAQPGGVISIPEQSGNEHTQPGGVVSIPEQSGNEHTQPGDVMSISAQSDNEHTQPDSMMSTPAQSDNGQAQPDSIIKERASLHGELNAQAQSDGSANHAEGALRGKAMRETDSSIGAGSNSASGDGAVERHMRVLGVQDHEALATAARDAYRRVFLENWLDWAVAGQPALREFAAAAQSARVDEFDRLDDVQLKIAQARLRQQLCANLPGSGHVVRGGDEYAVLMRELGKRQRHMPLRRLFSAIPNLLMRLKPCLMMSPLSVAYFLEAETYKFDLVIFDEASQIQPQDALGAIARGTQVVIAGDPLQLPPTRFFASALDDESDGEGDDEPLYDSILEGAGTALRRCMLKWHYRSRHEHLIAFSNAHIYGGSLITFPGARERQRDMGVEYVYVENGVYEGQGINQSEARRCVQLVHRHILTHPERSLGVIAFSQKQQAAIEYAIEQFRLSHPELEWFFGEADGNGVRRDEPFFIKNLENVQGDERDTIIFSIGYGRNRQGRMYMRFGPLSGAGGERRLNVAITRAKLNVKLVGSILPEDMDVSRTSAAGAHMLKGYMEFALHGASALGAVAVSQARRDEFADYIASMLARAGYIVERRVGCSAYRVDIALRRPEAQGAYFAGIECDGPMYATARTARERDHLRARVLEGMGWQLLRVWSREFLSDPEGQLQRVYEFAAAAYSSYTEDPPAPEPELEPEQDWLTSPPSEPESDSLRYGMAEYVVADWRAAPGAGERGAGLEACIKYIISIEQPIHIELLQRRLAGYFGNEKVTANSRRAVDEVLARLDGREIERTPEDFVYLTPRPPIRARTPAPGDAPRRIEHIAPEEIEECMCGIIAGTFGITPEALMSETVHALGYDRAGARITAALNSAYAHILSSGRAGLLDGKLKLTGGQ